MKFKYLVGEETDPYRNLATEQEILNNVAHDIAVLYLWQNDNTIVVGRNQDVYCECNVNDFLNEGGRIARRRSGGGAVYHDLGNLNFSIICDISKKESCEYQKLLIKVLRQFGIKADYNGRNDIMVCGKKCSGNSAYQSDEAICQHGTLLIATDIGRMVSFLTPKKSKLARNHVTSIESRVINLSEINHDINVESMIQAFIQITEACELEYTPNRNKIEQIAEFYKSREWVYGGMK